MSARPTPPGPRGSLLPGWVLAAGLSTAVCSGILDLGLSLWLESPAGLGSGAALLLVPAVTAVKRRRLRRLAKAWLATHDHHAPDLRFDVVAVHVPTSGPVRVTHLRNAF